jgi:hypothetical protein
MKTLKQIFEEIDLDNLTGYDLCYFCIAFGINIEDALHPRDEFHEGPVSSTIKCNHCYATEAEHGRLRLTPKQRKYATEVKREFERYRNEH